MNKDIGLSYDGFKVIEEKFFAKMSTPAATIKAGKFVFNKAFERELGEITHFQIFLDISKRKLVIKSCDEVAKYAYCWQMSRGKMNRSITLNRLFISIYAALGWSEKFRYKIIAKTEQNEDGRYFEFDLNNVEIYVPKSLIDKGD